MTIKRDQYGNQVQAGRPALSQTLAIGAGSVQSAPFGSGPVGSYNVGGTPITSPNNTMHVRLVASSGCWVVFGSNPVVVASASPAIYLPAYTPEYFWVVLGEQLAVIQDSAAGVLNIGEMAP